MVEDCNFKYRRYEDPNPLPEDRPMHNGRIAYDAPGMEHIRLVMQDEHDGSYYLLDRKVGSFNIIESSGYINKIYWKIDRHRGKTKHGPINPGPCSEYGKSLLKSMFAGW